MCKHDCKVVFLDRDGTMNEEVNYLYKKEDLKLIDGTAKAVRLLNEAGYKVIVVTNQAGVARGYYTESDVIKLHDYMNELLAREGAHVDAFYYCPHHPEHGIGIYKQNCHCRKPDTGMFEAAEKGIPEGIDKTHSYMIGDKRIDAQAGKNYGVIGILVGTGYGEKEHAADVAAGRIKEDGSCPEGGYDAYADTLLEAVQGILDGRI